MKKILIANVIALSLAACAAIEVNYDDVQSEAEMLISETREQVATKSDLPNVIYTDKYFVPELSFEDKDRPSWYFETVQFSYRDMPMNLIVSDIFGDYVSVRFLQGIDHRQRVSLHHNGTIGDAINKLAMATGYTFDLDGDILSWYKYRSEEFDISFLPGVSQFFLGERDGGTGRGTTGGTAGFQTVETGNMATNNDQHTSFEGGFDVVEDFLESVKLMLSESGQFSINRSTSTIVVRDTPQNVRDVERYVRQQNEALTKQVAIRVQVIDVTFTDNNQTSLDVRLMRESTGASTMASLFGGGSPGGAVLSGIGLARETGRWAGSEIFIEALKEQGIVQVVTEPQIVTMNNQMGRVNVENVRGYLASVGSNQVANAGSTDLLIPGEVTTGFSMYVLPRIQGDRIMMRLSATLSELAGLSEQSDGNRTIQVPEIDKKEFFLHNWVRNEETLLLSGLSTSRSDTRNDKGFMSQLLGGRRGTNRQRTETFILITPVITESGV